MSTANVHLPIADSHRALEAWWQSLHCGAAPLAAGGYKEGWWPARSPLEIMVTAILVQNTRWENVVRAVALLHAAGLLPADDSPAEQTASVRALHALGPAGLETHIRPAGCAAIKSRRLHNLLNFLVRVNGDLCRLAAIDTETLRRQLLGVGGVGPETADAILLYALNRAAFPVDAYLRRVHERHHWSVPKDTYAVLHTRVAAALGEDVAVLHRHHALIVEVAKRHCTKNPDCAACPLRHLLPPTREFDHLPERQPKMGFGRGPRKNSRLNNIYK